jgi:putative aldouronate transport system permease protein
MVKDRSFGSSLFDIFNHALLVILGLACILPLIHILMVSLSDRASTGAHLVTLWPINFNIVNYKWILSDQQFRQSLMITIMRVATATPLTVLVTVLFAFPLSIPEQFPGKQILKWMLIFSMLFSGGLVPWYLVMRQLHLTDSIWGLVLPGLVGAWNIIIVTNYFRGLPVELAESAKIDGASYWDILFKIYLPLSLPVLATIILFTAVGNWNSWFDGLILMSRMDHYPLMTFLQTQMFGDVQAAAMKLASDPELFEKLSDRAMRGAQIILTTVPILLLYPFLQKYFIHGLTLGSVKG